MLTRLRPILARVQGTRTFDLYMQAGEPIGIRHLCRAGTLAVFGRELTRLAIVPVDLALSERPMTRQSARSAGTRGMMNKGTEVTKT